MAACPGAGNPGIHGKEKKEGRPERVRELERTRRMAEGMCDLRNLYYMMESCAVPSMGGCGNTEGRPGRLGAPGKEMQRDVTHGCVVVTGRALSPSRLALTWGVPVRLI